MNGSPLYILKQLKFCLLSLPIVLLLTGCSGKPHPDPIIKGVNFVGLSVSDLEQAERFYSQAAAMSSEPIDHEPLTQLVEVLVADSPKVERASLMQSVNAQIILMQFDGSKIDGKARRNPIEVYGPGIAHVCYQADMETSAYQKFLELGAQTMGNPELVQLSDGNPVSYAYARDQDGTIFEVEHVDVEKLDLPTPPKHTHRIRHVSLASPDMSRTLEFYSTLMQNPSPRRLGRFFSIRGDKLDQVSGLPNSKIKMAFFPVRNLELEIIQYTSHSSGALSAKRKLEDFGYNMIVFEVSDLEAASVLVAEAGGQVISSSAISLWGVDTIFAKDIDGNLLGFQTIEPAAFTSSQKFKNNGI